MRKIMSLIPEFELGLWNAWIFILLVFIIPHLFLNKYWKARGWDEEARSYSKKEKKLGNILTVIFVASVIYGVFLPLKLCTTWFYVGLSIYLLGMIFLIMATLNFATTPLDKPVTKGAYHISRHPLSFAGFMTLTGMGIACISWIFLLLAVVFIILMNTLVIPEERWCLEKYGNAYREYMDRTPKWIGIPKSEKE
ncbi:MAG: isoprenylcysteine carboxylmethyltransferase family protein [Candidatus Bathyarchaeota archaeon]|nr:isoprenylcysteine carboxylmethyltransferase family protein [Candidatus Bathyarchaeota archaeon]MDH5732188.1 isoprenylcysteine carboxylmethyltransferase family protein [Candidatus Bathyarchaeota archaeon]